MENTKYGKRREGRCTVGHQYGPKAQDTRANTNSWETHLVRKRWDIGLLRALSLRIMMMIHTYMHTHTYTYLYIHTYTYIYIIHTYRPTYIHIHTYTYPDIHTCVFLYLFTCIYVCMNA